MKYCLKCGASNADSSKFCVECGTALVTAESDNTNFTYNEVDDTSSMTPDTAEDTSYSYGETVSDTTIVDTNYSEKSSADSEDKYKYTYNADNGTHTSYTSANPGIAPRNIVVAIILDALAFKRIGSRGATVKGIVVSVMAGVLMGFFFSFIAEAYNYGSCS